jgi:hypothetical protein
VKAVVQTVAWYVINAGMSIGTLAAVLIGARSIWQERGTWRTWPAAIGLLCAAIAYLVAWTSLFYQWTYGFDFNDSTVRMKFVRPTSILATMALVSALFAKRRGRTAILISSVLVQMYCVFQIDEI